MIYLNFDRSPKTVLENLGPLGKDPNLILVDCFTAGKGASSPVFLKFYQDDPPDPSRVVMVENPADMKAVSRELYKVHDRLQGDVRLVFDSLTGMQELWGGEEALLDFYAHSCPRLYELETIAYWIMEKRAHTSRCRARIAQLAQVVIELSVKRGANYLTIVKAEKRDPANFQKPFSYWTRGREVRLDRHRRTAGGLNLGAKIKNLRARAGISQTELARQVGVTPSTISQVESDLIYPSLPALLKIAEVLGVQAGAFFQRRPRLGNGPGFPFRPGTPGSPAFGARRPGRSQKVHSPGFRRPGRTLLDRSSTGPPLARAFFLPQGRRNRLRSVRPIGNAPGKRRGSGGSRRSDLPDHGRAQGVAQYGFGTGQTGLVQRALRIKAAAGIKVRPGSKLTAPGRLHKAGLL